MSVSGYILDTLDEDELNLVLSIHNDLSTDNAYINAETIKCMKFDFFIKKIIDSKSKANKIGIEKLNKILNKIDIYINDK